MLVEEGTNNWVLYRGLKSGHLKYVAFSDSKQNMFRVLQGIYETLLNVEELKKREVPIKEQDKSDEQVN